MRLRTKRPVESRTRPGYVHPIGSDATLVEALDPDKHLWFVEIHEPDDTLEGGVWHELFKLQRSDLQVVAADAALTTNACSALIGGKLR